MAEETKADARTEEPDSNSAGSQAAKKKSFFTRFLTLKWLTILLAVTVVVQGGILLGYRLLAAKAAGRPGAEITLGEFRFEADRSELGPVTAAEFSLHIALLEQVEKTARLRLGARRYRLQQDIEELLRQAHGGDFDDPGLGELKRRLQEQINDTLGLRAIADVIVTDLTRQFAQRNDSPPGQTAESVPWVEDAEGLAAATER